MEADALVFMLTAWGFTLGLLAFCVVMLIRNPQIVSVLTNNANNKEAVGEPGAKEEKKTE
ncbi:MAG: hypothetical protein RIG61_09085 [Deltaproteobacteria bacterium]